MTSQPPPRAPDPRRRQRHRVSWRK